MSKRTRRERIKKNTTKRNYHSFAVRLGFGTASTKPKIRRRRMKKVRRSSNYWHQHDPLTFSKIMLRDIELLWLEVNAPTATITWEKVPLCENMPAFKRGDWNGYAHFVRFPPEPTKSRSDGAAMLFRIHWWNSRL